LEEAIEERRLGDDETTAGDLLTEDRKGDQLLFTGRKRKKEERWHCIDPFTFAGFPSMW